MSSAGTAAQLSVTKGPPERGLFFVQSPGYEFLASAGLAVDADAGFAGGHSLDLGHDSPHSFASED